MSRSASLWARVRVRVRVTVRVRVSLRVRSTASASSAARVGFRVGVGVRVRVRVKAKVTPERLVQHNRCPPSPSMLLRMGNSLARVPSLTSLSLQDSIRKSEDKRQRQKQREETD